MSEPQKNSFHDFTVLSAAKTNYDLSQHKGKVILVVNVASKCGLTPQYAGLETLYKEFGNKNFLILGFPCNQFMGQEPGTNEEIQNFCSTSYAVTFPILDKIDVNGKNTAPVYQFMKEKAPGILGTEDVKWNFGKFLIDKEGQVLKRYAPTTEPKDLVSDIKAALS